MIGTRIAKETGSARENVNVSEKENASASEREKGSASEKGKGKESAKESAKETEIEIWIVSEVVNAIKNEMEKIERKNEMQKKGILTARSRKKSETNIGVVRRKKKIEIHFDKALHQRQTILGDLLLRQKATIFVALAQ